MSEPMHESIRRELDRLRAEPGRWGRMVGYHDKAMATRVAERLGVHPDCRGYAFAVSDGAAVGKPEVGWVISGCYHGAVGPPTG